MYLFCWFLQRFWTTYNDRSQKSAFVGDKHQYQRQNTQFREFGKDEITFTTGFLPFGQITTFQNV